MNAAALFFSLLLFAPLFAGVANAADSASEADYAALKKMVAPHVYFLEKPVLIYNWHGSPKPEFLTKSSRDPRDFANIQKMTNRYWERHTDPSNTGAMYGTGLYGAIDPVATRSYGGNGEDWVLSEIRLKAGTKILDVVRDGNNVLPLDQADLVTRLGCPKEWKHTAFLENFINPTKYSGYPKCAAVARRLFKDELKIDAFAYNYNATNFKACSKDGQYRRAAFVLVGGDKVSADDVRVFSRLTTDDDEARTRIQSLFVKAFFENVIGDLGGPSASGAGMGDQVIDYLNNNGFAKYVPWFKMNMSFVGETVDGATNWRTLICEPGTVPAFSDGVNIAVTSNENCLRVVIRETKDGPVKSLVEPTTISASQLPKRAFLWNDLEGRPTANLTDWMRTNLYDCGDRNIYKPAHRRVQKAPGAAAEEFVEANDGETGDSKENSAK